VSDKTNSDIPLTSAPATNRKPGDLPTMPDPTRENPEQGPHLPAMPDPMDDPERGQQLPTEPDPVRKPPKINDPLPDQSEGSERIA